MNRLNRILTSFKRNWPGSKRFGFYSYLPILFAFGASLELFMIKFHVGEANFYSIWVRNALRDQERAREEQMKMPFGLSWSTYIFRISLGLLAVAAGSQTVHHIYKPIDNKLSQLMEQKKLDYEKRIAEASKADKS